MTWSDYAALAATFIAGGAITAAIGRPAHVLRAIERRKAEGPALAHVWPRACPALDRGTYRYSF